MATPQDAELILKLYELRTEPLMREARKFVSSFNPASFDELAALHRDSGSEQNAYWRQALSYWEMACALVLRGAIDADLFTDCNGEHLFFYAKFTPFLEQYQATFGLPFMRQTAALIEKYPAARARYDATVARMEAGRKKPAN
jgi:hypothetical protein